MKASKLCRGSVRGDPRVGFLLLVSSFSGFVVQPHWEGKYLAEAYRRLTWLTPTNSTYDEFTDGACYAMKDSCLTKCRPQGPSVLLTDTLRTASQYMLTFILGVFRTTRMPLTHVQTTCVGIAMGLDRPLTTSALCCSLPARKAPSGFSLSFLSALNPPLTLSAS